MARKQATTTGAEFKKFYHDDSVWNPGKGQSWYLEEEIVEVNGQVLDDALDEDPVASIPDDAQVVITDGWMGWQGDGEDPSKGQGLDFVAVFQAWAKARTTLTVTASLDIPVDTPPQELARIREVLEAMGAKVSGLPEPGDVQAKAKSKPRA